MYNTNIADTDNLFSFTQIDTHIWNETPCMHVPECKKSAKAVYSFAHITE
jgi:hypothetical protein